MKKLIALFIFISLILIIWLWWGTKKDRAAFKFLGDYELASYNCEDCVDCSVKLSYDYTYDIFQGDSTIGKGTWDLGLDYQSAMFFLEFDNGYKGSLNGYLKKINHISNINCCLKYCDELVTNSFEGRIIDIKTYRGRKHQKSILLILSNGDTIADHPRFSLHPWLQDTVEVGDILIKKKDYLKYILIKPSLDSITLDYGEMNCPDFCLR